MKLIKDKADKIIFIIVCIDSGLILLLNFLVSYIKIVTAIKYYGAGYEQFGYSAGLIFGNICGVAIIFFAQFFLIKWIKNLIVKPKAKAI